MTQSLSINEFCERNSISRSLFYKLLKVGKGPRFMKVGNRTLISIEAEAQWHKDMEVESIH